MIENEAFPFIFCHWSYILWRVGHIFGAQIKGRSILTISTSEMVSRLSTWTSTPTGIGGPEIKGMSQQMEIFNFPAQRLSDHACVSGFDCDRWVQMTTTATGWTLFLWPSQIRGMAKCRATACVTALHVYLFQPFPLRHHHPLILQQYLGHSEVMQPWMRSSRRAHDAGDQMLQDWCD